MLGLAPPLGRVARADLVPSVAVNAADRHGAQAREHLAAWLARGDVAAELARLGVEPEEARRRLAALSDAEAQALAQRIDALPAGGGFGAVVLVVAIVLAVLIITDALGLTDVFPWVREVN
jgi:hypothetical protein